MATERSFDFLLTNPRPPKPRSTGMTEIRGPYYSPMGPRYLADLLETMGDWIDSLKFAAGSFTLLSAAMIRSIIDLCHQHQVTVSTGGFIERVLTQGPQAVDRYIARCAELNFDTMEISSGFLALSTNDTLKLIDKVHGAKMKAKVEVGVQFGAGGASAPAALEAQGLRDVDFVIEQTRRAIDAGCDAIMIESEGITESVTAWRAEIPGKFAAALGIERIMFEAADPEVFAWYIQNFGPAVNLFVDHSQIVQLEALRQGIWGTQNLWGRVIGLA